MLANDLPFRALEQSSICIMSVGTMLLFIVLYLYVRSRYYRLIIFASYCIRILALLWDRYCSHIYMLPNAIWDCDLFHEQALVMLSPTTTFQTLDVDSYSRMVGFIYRIFGPQRLLAQYVNVLLGIAAVGLIITTLRSLSVGEQIVKRVAMIAAFFPQGVILSALLLRESVIVFFVCASIYLYIQWYLGRGWAYGILTVMTTLCASVFHNGMIVMLPTFAVMLVFYDSKRERLHLTHWRLATITAVSITLVALFWRTDLIRVFIWKFTYRNLYTTVNEAVGGSVYLASITIDSLLDMVTYAPVRIFYFLFSPLPWDWRGPVDALSFLLDSAVYLAIAVIVATRSRHSKRDRWLVLSLVAAMTLVVAVFSFSTYNAGTAIRHRNKTMLGQICIAAIVVDRSIRRSGQQSSPGYSSDVWRGGHREHTANRESYCTPLSTAALRRSKASTRCDYSFSCITDIIPGHAP